MLRQDSSKARKVPLRFAGLLFDSLRFAEGREGCEGTLRLAEVCQESGEVRQGSARFAKVCRLSQSVAKLR